MGRHGPDQMLNQGLAVRLGNGVVDSQPQLPHAATQIVELVKQQQHDGQGVFVDLQVVAQTVDQTNSRHVNFDEQVGTVV